MVGTLLAPFPWRPSLVTDTRTVVPRLAATYDVAADGKTMVSASWEGRVKLWDVSPVLAAK